MNVYDFDDTIFHPYSSILFVLFCLKRHPLLIITFFPKCCLISIKYIFNHSYEAKVAETFNGVTKHLKNTDEDVKAFWDKYESNLSSWYLKQRKPDDLVISGSPDYLLEPLANKLGFKVICSKVDKVTGEKVGPVMMGKTKAKYIIEQEMPLIDNFYSDSLSDTPIALLAEKAFIVTDKATTIKPWPHMTMDLASKVRKRLKKF